jgi:hypothetical protein
MHDHRDNQATPEKKKPASLRWRVFELKAWQCPTWTRAIHGARPLGGLRPSKFVPDEFVTWG